VASFLFVRLATKKESKTMNWITELFAPKKILGTVIVMVVILAVIHNFVPATWKQKIGIA